MKVELPYIIRINPLFVIFFSLLIIIAPFLIWSNYAKLEQISRAKGIVIATAKKQEIQTVNDGVIEKILVSEGQTVKKGQVIAKLDESQFQANYEATKSKVASLEASLSRLESEIYNKSLEFTDLSKQYPEFINSQKALYKRRKEALNDEIDVLKNALKLANDELHLNKPLVKTGDIGAIELIKLERQVADIEGQIVNRKNKYFQEVQTEFTKVEEELSIQRQELADKEVTLNRSEIKSPMDAIVNNILITTQGAKVRAGDVIMELVPIDELVMEAKLSPSDISFVNIGQRASVKLDAYDFTIFGGFEGEVTHVSSDTLVEQTNKGEELFFRVLISLKGNNITSKVGKKVVISPGMTGQIDIITGERTVLNYLAKPVIKTLDESFTER
ncbi:secretion protein [Malaciobacter mytili]|uniref:HlyD family efflux transporter periplasmic adaptor subunit n=1 Tax=Malaciobacter mytili TaxID=603050 RepID=UPI00100B222B|nr:HlyD family efflux transporter periplasmic adaptor subunit [Malaciobacter mytili]RXI37610.1 secretion protein [Malaciobacter mytili]